MNLHYHSDHTSNICKFSTFSNVHTVHNCCHVSKTCCLYKLSNWLRVCQIVKKYRYSLTFVALILFPASIVFILYTHVPGTDYERILIIISLNCSFLNFHFFCDIHYKFLCYEITQKFQLLRYCWESLPRSALNEFNHNY